MLRGGDIRAQLRNQDRMAKFLEAFKKLIEAHKACVTITKVEEHEKEAVNNSKQQVDWNVFQRELTHCQEPNLR